MMDLFAFVLFAGVFIGAVIGWSMRKRRKPTPEIFRSLHQTRRNHERDNATHRSRISPF